MPAWKRHIYVASLSLIFVLIFYVTRLNWHPMHAWNRAFADSALLLLILTLALGPIGRVVTKTQKALHWRRELGIWSAVLSFGHVFIVLDGWVMWNLKHLFKVPFYDQLVIHPGFAIGNLIGIVALGYISMLAVISNQFSVRMLGTQAWNYLQQQTFVLYVLVMLHAVYFAYFHMPEQPNWLRSPLIWAIVMLFMLKTIVFAITVRRRGAM